MKRLLLIIGVSLLLVVAGCSEISNDDPPEEIQDPADVEESADAMDDHQTEEADDTDDSGTEDSTDDKDPPDSTPGEDHDVSLDNDHDETRDDGLSETRDEGNENSTSGNGTLEIHSINVGQADATLLVGPGGDTMLIDSGDWPDEGRTVLDYLDSKGIERLDHLVTTHAHADHIGGHAAVIETFETEKDGVGQVWDPGVTHTSQTYEQYIDAIDEHDVTLFQTRAGDEIPMEGLNATVLNPAENSAQPDDQHYNSLSILVEHGEVGFLATGDAQADAEERLVEQYGSDLEAELYHAGHHGSNTSSRSEFLAAVDPELTIISSAYDSQYGHPHEEVLVRFTEHEVGAVWTAVHGSTIVESNGSSYTVEAQAASTTIPLLLRDETEITADSIATPDYDLDLPASEDFELPTEHDGDETDTDDETNDTEDDVTDPDGETDGGETDRVSGSNLGIEPRDAGSTATHTWSFDDVAFSGEVEEITVEYPDGTSFDGVTASAVTVTMTRALSDGPDTSEIRVNQGTYGGTSATFDLDGRYTTDLVGSVEIVIDGIENPPAGEYSATITFKGEDDEVTMTEEFTTV